MAGCGFGASSQPYSTSASNASSLSTVTGAVQTSTNSSSFAHLDRLTFFERSQLSRLGEDHDGQRRERQEPGLVPKVTHIWGPNVPFGLSRNSFEESKDIVLGLLDGISEAADIAYREGEQLRMRAGVGSKVIAKTVELQIGSAFHNNGEVAIPLRWEATGPTGLFPTMEAELILGRLEPRFAEATVKHFVDRVGAAVIGWPRVKERSSNGTG